MSATSSASILRRLLRRWYGSGLNYRIRLSIKHELDQRWGHVSVPPFIIAIMGKQNGSKTIIQQGGWYWSASTESIPSFWNRTEDNNVFLHLGENPYAPTNAVRKAIEDAARHANRYPDTNCGMLREVIAEYVGYSVKPENVIVGNGSDE